MRTLILSLGLIFTIHLASATVFVKGESNTFLNAYTVEQKAENLYELSYENSASTFSIEVDQLENRCNYLVKGENVEVLYFCCKNGMCLRKVPQGEATVSIEYLKKYLDPKAFGNQALLTNKQKKTEEALGLIACFFPEVFLNDSRSVVFKPTATGNTPLTAQN